MAGVAEIMQGKRTKWVLDRRTGKVRSSADNTVVGLRSFDPQGEGERRPNLHQDQRIPRVAKGRLGRVPRWAVTGAGALMKRLLSLNRFPRPRPRTNYNPEFMVSNMLRDIEAALWKHQ